MDKSKIKFLLIAVACLLVLFLAYRIVSRISESKIATQDKLDNAEADLEIKKNLDAYAMEREQIGKEAASEKVEIHEEIQKAEGYNQLNDYMNTLSEEQREEYKSLWNLYGDVMGVSAGLMSYSDLLRWNENYVLWKELNDQYIELTGESKKFNDVDFDTVEEMKAAVETAKSDIEAAWEQAWQDEYALFCIDHETNGVSFKGCSYISLADLRRWLDSPTEIQPFQAYLTQQFNAYTDPQYGTLVNVNNVYGEVVKYFNSGYVHWKNSKKNFVRGANDLPEGTYQDLNRMKVNEFAYISKLLDRDGGVKIWSRVDAFNAPHDKKTWTNFLDASLAVANFQYSYEKKVNPVWAALSLGASAAIQKDKKIRSYMPQRLNNLMSRVEASNNEVYTPFGYTNHGLVDIALPAYSQKLYGFSDSIWGEIETNKMDISDFVNSDDYKKSILNN